MKTNYLYIPLAFLFSISCEENFKKEELALVPLEEDEMFISVMETNRIVLEKFDKVSGETIGEKAEYIAKVKELLQKENNYKDLVKMLGYTDESEFEKVNIDIFNKLNALNKKYPQLNRGNNFIYNFSQSVKVHLSKEITESNLREAEGGCKGGLPCFRQAVDCDHDAEVGFAVASASCLGFSAFPPLWAVCQGSAFLVEAGEKLECASQLEACCGLTPTPA